MKSYVALVACLAGLVLSAPAKAADNPWSSSFAHIDGLELAQKRVLVVAGAKDKDSQQATAALITALRSADTALVLDSSTAGDMAGLEDSKILDKTKKLPVDVRIITRAFAGEPPTLVLSLYDNNANMLAAHSIKRGEVLFAGGLGVKSDVDSNTIGQVIGASKPTAEAIDQYAKKFLWIGTGLYVGQYGGGTYDVVFQGKYKKELTRRELFDLLADEEIEKRNVEVAQGNAVWAIGTALVSTALIVPSVLGFVFYTQTSFDSPAADLLLPVLVVSTSGATFGVLGLLWSASFASGAFADDGAQLTSDELRMHIERYNKKLQKELKLEGVSDLPTGFSGPMQGAGAW